VVTHYSILNNICELLHFVLFDTTEPHVLAGRDARRGVHHRPTALLPGRSSPTAANPPTPAANQPTPCRWPRRWTPLAPTRPCSGSSTKPARTSGCATPCRFHYAHLRNEIFKTSTVLVIRFIATKGDPRFTRPVAAVGGLISCSV
jgi:hypothetical protein